MLKKHNKNFIIIDYDKLHNIPIEEQLKLFNKEFKNNLKIEFLIKEKLSITITKQDTESLYDKKIKNYTQVKNFINNYNE